MGITCEEYTNLQTRSSARCSSITPGMNQPKGEPRKGKKGKSSNYISSLILRWPGRFCPHPLRIKLWTQQTENFPQPDNSSQNLPWSFNHKKDVKYSPAQTRLPSQRCQATRNSSKCFMSWHFGFTVTPEQFKRSNLFCGFNTLRNQGAAHLLWQENNLSSPLLFEA